MVVDKQETGFKFGKKPTRVIEVIDELKHKGRTYRLCKVETGGGIYHSLRLYNGRGKFIKQFMSEPEIASDLAGMYVMAATRRVESGAVCKLGSMTFNRR